VVTLTELTGIAVATYEANEATASVTFVASVGYKSSLPVFKVGISSQQINCFVSC